MKCIPWYHQKIVIEATFQDSIVLEHQIIHQIMICKNICFFRMQSIVPHTLASALWLSQIAFVSGNVKGKQWGQTLK